MAPQLLTVGLMSRAQATADEVDTTIKWWDDYSTPNYLDHARPESTYSSYISDVWSKPKRLARSASYTNLTYVKEAVHDYPIRRSTSVSSLAPSLALPQYYREPERIVHTTPVYKPQIYDWYSKAYSRAHWIDTHETIQKPLRRYYDPLQYSSHVPYYTFLTKRIFFDQKRRQPSSYIEGSKRYLDKYVAARLKADDFAQHYAYTAYEWRYPQDHSFNRHFMYGEGVYVPHAPRNPHSYHSAQALRKLYITSGRFRFA